MELKMPLSWTVHWTWAVWHWPQNRISLYPKSSRQFVNRGRTFTVARRQKNEAEGLLLKLFPCSLHSFWLLLSPQLAFSNVLLPDLYKAW